MFERFTNQSRLVVLAQEEARMLDHNYIGTGEPGELGRLRARVADLESRLREHDIDPDERRGGSRRYWVRLRRGLGVRWDPARPSRHIRLACPTDGCGTPNADLRPRAGRVS
jgi:hypothetical protein